MFLFVAYLISKAMWVQMDIPGQFQHGTVSMRERLHIISLPDILVVLTWNLLFQM